MEAGFLTKVVLPISLIIIMLGMGLSLVRDDFARILKEPRAVAVGVFCQMLVLPAVALALVFLFGLPGELGVGLMILAFCPGGATSNMLSYLSRGDVALSITLTAIVSVVAPFSVPLLTALAMTMLMDQSQQFAIPVGQTIVQLLAITIVPVIVGMQIRWKWPGFAARAERPVKIYSVVILFVIIAGIVLKNKDNMAGFFVQTGAATLALNVVTLLAGYFIAQRMRLSRRQAITVAIEGGVQNGTLALFVTGTLLGSSVMTVPAVTYSLLMFATGGLFGWWVNRGRAAGASAEAPAG